MKLKDALHPCAWAGRANSLSPAHVHWPVIDEAAQAAWRVDAAMETSKHAGAIVVDEFAECPGRPGVSPQIKAVALIKQRRSSLSLDGATSITAGTFYGMLDRLLPRAEQPRGTSGPGRRICIASFLCIE